MIECPLLVRYGITIDNGGRGLCLTCSQEHDFILSILCKNSVHHNLSQGVVHSDTCEHGSASQRVDRAIHKRVESNETDHLIREVFGGLDPWIICLTGTLKGQNKKCWSGAKFHHHSLNVYSDCYINVFLNFFLANWPLFSCNLLVHVSLWWSKNSRRQSTSGTSVSLLPPTQFHVFYSANK